MREELACAEAHDAAGRHDEAINALARATRAGDVEAMTRLGKRLATGDRAPFLPRDGIGFLIDAANAGGAEAPARLAFLFAVGAYLQQSWDEALRYLVAAAERGWGPARDQLLLLGTDAEPAIIRAENTDCWGRIAEAIEIDSWAQVMDGVTLLEAPLVRSWPEMIPAHICRWIIEQSSSRLQRARVYDAVEGADKTHSIRTNRTATFNLMETEFVHALIQTRMALNAGVPLANLEAPAVLNYRVGEQIGDHYDFVDPRTPSYAEEIRLRGQRVITFLLYLNDDYQGGETAFPKLGVSHRGRCGEGLLFVNALPDGSPDLRTVHAGRPPQSGEKWIVSQFIRDRRALAAAQ